jgi:hypothetical protein
MLWLHGTPSTPAVIFTSTSASGNYSAYQINFGAAATGASSPYLPEFPSLTEKGYSFPPEVVGDGGVEVGVHLVITTACTIGSGCTGGTLNVYSDTTDGAVTNIAARTFTLAQLAIVGAHYFVPVTPAALSQYLRCGFQAITYAVGTGYGVAWFGPKTGGEQ